MTFGTAMQRNCYPQVCIQRSPRSGLGHSSISTTLDLYSHVSQTMQEDAAVKLDTAFRSAINAARIN